MLDRLRYFRKMVEWKHFSLSAGRCPLCGPSIFVRLFERDFGVRSLRCGAAQNTFSLAHAIQQHFTNISLANIHLVTAGGPYFAWLDRHSGKLWTSQYFDNVEPGSTVNGTRCEDLQHLTYPDQTFNLVTSSEVIEHVPNDDLAFKEMYRVLKPQGMLIFTVPLNLRSEITVERARLNKDGSIEHILEAEFHDDPIRGRILAFRNYGRDILKKLEAAGFIDCEILTPPDPSGFGRERPVVMASRPIES